MYVLVEAKEWRQREDFVKSFEFRRELSKHGMWFPERLENVFRKDKTWKSQRREEGKL